MFRYSDSIKSVKNSLKSSGYRWQPQAVGAILLIFALHAGCGKEASVPELVARGEEFRRQGNLEEAKLSFRKAIQLDKSHAAAHLGLARAYNRPETIAEALALYEKATELAPNDVSAWVEFGDVALAFFLSSPARPDPLRNQMGLAAKAVQRLNPKSADPARWQAYQLLQDGENAQALAVLEQATPLDPNNRKAKLALVVALLANHQRDRALSLANQLVTADPQDWLVYDGVAAYFRNQAKDLITAEEWLNRKLAQAPERVDFRLDVARNARFRMDAGAVERVLAPMLSDAKLYPRGPIQAAEFFLETQATGPAESALRKGLETHPALARDLNLRIARLLGATQKFPEAWQMTEALLREFPADEEMAALEADLALLSKDSSRYAGSVSRLERLLQNKPDAAPLLHALGRVLAEQGNLLAAIQRLEEAVRADAKLTPARLSLVRVLMTDRDFAKALTQVNALLEKEPDNPDYRLLRVMCRRGMGAIAEAREELQDLKSRFPGFRLLQIEQANLELAEGKGGAAEASLRALGTQGRGSLLELTANARALAASGQVERAMQLLASARGMGSNAELELEMGEIRFLAAQFAEAVRHFERADAAMRLPPAVLGRYAEAAQMTGEIPRAEKLARRALEIEPDRIQRKAFLASLVEAQGRHSEAMSIYREVVRIQPSNLGAANNLAFLLAKQGEDLEEAERLAMRCVRDRSDIAQFSDTLGFVQLQRKKFDQAVQSFRAAIAREPGVGAYHYRLSLAYLAKGDKPQAVEAAKMALQRKLLPEERSRMEAVLR